jgi:hypothetical protein
MTQCQDIQKMSGILPEQLYQNERSRNGTTRAERKRVEIYLGPAKELDYDIIVLVHPVDGVSKCLGIHRSSLNC